MEIKRRSIAGITVLLSLWMIVIAGMSLHMATVNAGDDYERHVKNFAISSLVVACLVFIYALAYIFDRHNELMDAIGAAVAGFFKSIGCIGRGTTAC